MFRSSTARAAVIAVAVLIALGLLRYKPWQHSRQLGVPGGGQAAALPEGTRPQLTYGFSKRGKPSSEKRAPS